ncbi:MAG: hypothetical protein JJU45_05460 [Acidimicrobiia bacterium]|nr:hypothetical protein [Acidimicrobiia bacterium]
MLPSAWVALACAGIVVATPAAMVVAGGIGGTLFVAAVVAGCASLVAVVAITANPRAAVLVTLGYLLGLGVLRRLLAWGLGGELTNDPLLLVGPAVALLLIVLAAQRGRLHIDSTLSGLVLALGALAVVWALNPFAGSVLSGLSSLLFFFVPTLWFWVGKAYLDDRLFRSVVYLLVGAAAASALYAQHQVLNGFPAWDAAWVEQGGYAALNVGGSIRPFGASVSAAEMVSIIMIGVLLVAFALPKLPTPVRVAGVAFLLYALVLGGSRTPVVIVVVLLALIPAIRSRGAQRIVLVPLLVVLALVTLNWSLQQVDVEALDERVAPFVNHVVQGLEDPMNDDVSTANIHIEMVVNAVQAPMEHPIGRGQQSFTLAGSRFGETALGSAEHDLGNVALAWGLPGLVLFVALAFNGFRTAFRLVRLRRDTLSLVALIILLATFGNWLNGGEYGVSTLAWLALGWLDRQRASPDATTPTSSHGKRPVAATPDTETASPSRSPLQPTPAEQP